MDGAGSWDLGCRLLVVGLIALPVCMYVLYHVCIHVRLHHCSTE